MTLKKSSKQLKNDTGNPENESPAYLRRVADCINIPLENLWIAYEAARETERQSNSPGSISDKGDGEGC